MSESIKTLSRTKRAALAATGLGVTAQILSGCGIGADMKTTGVQKDIDCNNLAIDTTILKLDVAADPAQLSQAEAKLKKMQQKMCEAFNVSSSTMALLYKDKDLDVVSSEDNGNGTVTLTDVYAGIGSDTPSKSSTFADFKITDGKVDLSQPLQTTVVIDTDKHDSKKHNLVAISYDQQKNTFNIDATSDTQNAPVIPLGYETDQFQAMDIAALNDFAKQVTIATNEFDQ